MKSDIIAEEKIVHFGSWNNDVSMSKLIVLCGENIRSKSIKGEHSWTDMPKYVTCPDCIEKLKTLGNDRLNNLKIKMKKYRGLFGEELLRINDIDDAETTEELKEILDDQIGHIQNIECGMQSHLSNFRKELYIDWF